MLKEAGIRCETDQRAEKIGYKIRSTQLEKVPYMLVVGEKEENAGNLSVRDRDNGDLGRMSTGQFLEILNEKGIRKF